MTFEVRYSSEIAKDLDDAFSKALADLSSGWEWHYQKAQYLNTKTVDFTQEALGSFLENTSAPTLVVPRIENVEFTKAGYVVTLYGMWRGQVTIGEDLTVKEPFHRLEGQRESIQP